MDLKVRRVITATGDNGRSHFMIDDVAGNILEQPGRGLTFHELWVTDGPKASNEGTVDEGAPPVEHHPPAGGTRFRIVEFMPDEQQQSDRASEDFQRLSASDILTGDTSDPSMHRNETTDYNIILEGEIVAKTEDGEVLLRRGDVLIQRGTAHTWHNRSDRSCIFASIMVSAEPLQRFAKSNAQDTDQ